MKTSFETGAPSNIYKGEVPALREVYPRTRIEEVAVGSPEEVNTCIPATCPWSASAKFIVGFASNTLLLTVETEPTTEPNFLPVPYPITTTSSTNCESDFRITFMLGLISPSYVAKPMNDIRILCAELGMFDKVKLPSVSVMVPISVPIIETEAPTTGKLSSSEITTPVTLEVCAIIMFVPTSKHVNNKFLEV